jgi:hypothetical protein
MQDEIVNLKAKHKETIRQFQQHATEVLAEMNGKINTYLSAIIAELELEGDWMFDHKDIVFKRVTKKED